MEVTSSGLYVFRDIHTRIPAETRRFPDSKLAQNLSRAGIRSSRARNIQLELEAGAVRVAEVTADLFTTPQLGRSLKNILDNDDPNWSGYGLTYSEGTVAQAVTRTVGSGWHSSGRFFFDGLVMDARRVAIITGNGMVQGEEWFLCDEREWRTNMRNLVRELEASSRYGAIVADVRKPTGGIPRFTESTPLFFRLGKKSRRDYYNP